MKEWLIISVLLLIAGALWALVSQKNDTIAAIMLSSACSTFGVMLALLVLLNPVGLPR